MARFNINLKDKDSLIKHLNIIRSHLGALNGKGGATHFIVNVNDVNELKSLHGDLSERIKVLTDKEYTKPDKWIVEGKKYDLIQKIWNTDISVLFSELSLSSEKKFYVYVHCDPTKKLKVRKRAKDAFSQFIGLKSQPFYIGKGTGDRYRSFDRHEVYKKRRDIISASHQPIEIKKIKENISETEALEIEAKLIDIYGFEQEGGCLVNLDSGYNPYIRKRMYPYECWELFPKSMKEALEMPIFTWSALDDENKK